MHASRADIALHETLRVMRPIARVLVANGVTYPQFIRALKGMFLQAARDELANDGQPATDSALSLLSGVHRKDVRAMKAEDGAAPARPRALSLPADVAARWMQAREFLDAAGAPAVLPLRGRTFDEASFDLLVQSVSKDFHTRSVLDEMLRLGVAVLEGDRVRLRVEGFAPAEGFAAMASDYGANAAAHVAAADANLRAVNAAEAAPFYDFALTTDELSAASTEMLQQLVQKLWPATFSQIAAEAEARAKDDAPLPPPLRPMRIRFGAYFYAEPVPHPAPAAAAEVLGERSDNAAAGVELAHPAAVRSLHASTVVSTGESRAAIPATARSTTGAQ